MRMKVIGCQLDLAWEDRKANHAKVLDLLAKHEPVEPGSLIVLPEMFASGFSMNTGVVAEQAGGDSERFLEGLARHYGSFVIGGIARIAADGRPRNEALVLTPGGALLNTYAKMQPFSLGGETTHYTAGDDVIVFDWRGLRVAPFICYDLRFPELFRTAARRGAECFVVIASWPVKRIGHWTTLLRARAIENQAYVVGVNRSGTDPFFTYTGQSIIVNSHGDVIADAGSDEGVIKADVDLAVVRDWREQFPALRDMRRDG